MNRYLSECSREELLELIDMYSKNCLAMDGVWFQSVEESRGMDEAMFHDLRIWDRFTRIEAERIKAFLKLPPRPGLEGLLRALGFRFYANINEDEALIEGHRMVYRILDCRVQTARKRKGMPFHPCRSVGLVEYTGFAQTIDERLECRCLSCFPEITDESCACAWEFTLKDGCSPAD